ncbi:DUF6352 family protein [Arenibaculum pallidiluteum]|uniref:DUF6352 family protein n=1 Tax=Arenibaculum pallidiluteum TaxID=2812559 RepID=UPI001A9768AC|nr:DUF6352 family protein [Arenibaculum pallidiluteum]
MSRDFWTSSGYRLLAPGAGGGLAVTDDFLRAYLLRPEISPIAESCEAERSLHAALLDAPASPVQPSRIAAIRDADARENWEVFLAFRDLLLAHPTLEAAYLAVVRGQARAVPALFLDQIVHAVLRGVLDGTEDPLRLRAAELLFRAQRVRIEQGAVLVADQEIVEARAQDGGFGALGRLVSEAGTSLRGIELDVLNEHNGDVYWERSDRFDTVLETTFGRPGLDALCRVLEAWTRHFLDVAISIQPVQQISDERWVWHLGLDAEATAVLNDLYEGRAVDEDRMYRILALFRIDFADPSVMLPRVSGRPVYMAMAMTPGGVLRLKPQNLLVNLPLIEGN